MTPLPLLRQSERATFKRCQWMWYQSYVMGLQPMAEKWTEAADFGTIFHVCMAEYYLPGKTRGAHPTETWRKLAGDVRRTVRVSGDDDKIATWEDFYTLGEELTEAYIELYQGDPHWDVLDAERRFDVLIPDVRHPRSQSAKGRRIYKPIVKLVGTIDLCFRDLNQESKGMPVVKMVDHKTVGRIEYHHLTLDEQASTYISVATHALREQGLIGDKEVVKGMEYNFIKRAAIDRRPRDENGLARNNPIKKHYVEALISAGRAVGWDPEKLAKKSLAELGEMASGLRVFGDVSADQKSGNFFRWFVPRTPEERQRQIVRISEEARVMDDVRHGRLPLLKTPTKDCFYCKFFELCELDEAGGDVEYFAETTMKRQDPYADHRAGADNSKKVGDGSESEGQGDVGTESVPKPRAKAKSTATHQDI